MSSFAELGNDLYSGRRSFDIVGKRRVWYITSAVLIVLSLIGLFGRGLNFGIEFSGGSEFRISSVNILDNYDDRASEALAKASPDAVASVTLVGNDTVRLQTGQLTNDVAEEARVDLADAFGVEASEVTSSFVGPSWGQTVTNKALQALVAFLVLVSIVLALYFRTWKMAAAAMVALLHDVVFTVGTYALLGIEVSPASMIGFLTILGYSIYDTIVVFDKVKENTDYAISSKRMTYAEGANLAVNQTLVRSINTSVVALLPVATIVVIGILFIGPGTLLDLAIALLIGIAIGTFSSIFIATPLLVHLRESEPEMKALAKGVAKREKSAPVVEQSDDADDDDVHDVDDDADAATQGGNENTSATRESVAGRTVHPYAERGPRNQPKRTRRSRR
ncbi:protein translocase subunit SecF [Ornithinimicrobium sp. INDO-MA30-4]|uniref:protein translocase subunit SecF n=1 Tax=Ornithinimicrobium sp. INDO-MA30-4 TaxID=2908651 RepID=UPI001F2303EF|nr:protein translocase subunit SecF [Ornithinimicrobium sp. INDO-MA30-4]UJH71157.1 protein translocase subunit SecF [Ornithinimicrobium sp. INDO-MA30-4]